MIILIEVFFPIEHLVSSNLKCSNREVFCQNGINNLPNFKTAIDAVPSILHTGRWSVLRAHVPKTLSAQKIKIKEDSTITTDGA